MRGSPLVALLWVPSPFSKYMLSYTLLDTPDTPDTLLDVLLSFTLPPDDLTENGYQVMTCPYLRCFNSFLVSPEQNREVFTWKGQDEYAHMSSLTFGICVFIPVCYRHPKLQAFISASSSQSPMPLNRQFCLHRMCFPPPPTGSQLLLPLTTG